MPIQTEHERAWLDSIATNVRSLRRGQSLSQSQLATKMGCSQPTVAQMEKGGYTTLTTLYHAATALGMKPIIRLAGIDQGWVPTTETANPEELLRIAAINERSSCTGILKKLGRADMAELISLSRENDDRQQGKIS